MHDIINECGSRNLPGLKVPTYWVPKKDIDTFPGYLATTEPGDSVTLDGDIVLGASKKFFRVDVVTDSGEVKDTQVGEIGSAHFESTFDFMVPKTDPKQIEFMKNAAYGCWVVLVKDKMNNLRVFGDPEIPAKVVSSESTTGKNSGSSRGLTMQLKSTIGEPAPFYTGAIDIDDAT
jgi:hypothetical protein